MSGEDERELEMVEAGRARARHIEETQGLAYSQHGRHLVTTATRRMAAWVERWRARVLEQPRDHVHEVELLTFDGISPLAPEVAAFATINSMVVGVTWATATMASLSGKVGGAVEEEIVFRELRKRRRKLWDHNQQRWKKHSRARRIQETKRAYLRDGVDVRNWTPEERNQVGSFLVQAALTHAGIFDVDYEIHGTYLRLSEECKEWLTRSRDAYLDARPRFMPCTGDVLDWTGMWEGGFIHPVLRQSAMIVKTRPQLEFYEQNLSPYVLGALNILQQVEFDVVPETLEVLSHFLDNDWERAGLLKPQIRDLPRIRGEKGSAVWKDSRRDRGRVWRRNRDEQGRRYEQFYVQKTLRRDLGETLKFVHRADLNGRMYPQSTYVSPQGSKYIRAHLQFKEAMPVEDERALYWLKVSGANLAGQDKLALNARAQWVDDNLPMIRAIYQDPLDCPSWETMDSPWEFLAWVMDFVPVIDQGAPTRHPVALDGSNNGVALLSIMCRDAETAWHCNAKGGKTADDAPEDVYRLVAADAYKRIRAVATTAGHPDASKARALIRYFDTRHEGVYPRGLSKRPTMCFGYSVSPYSVFNYLMQWVREDAAERGDRDVFRTVARFDVMHYLRRETWDAMIAVLDGPARVMEWLKACGDVLRECGQAPRWVSPSGMPVLGARTKIPGVAASLVWGERTRLVQGRQPAPEIDSRKTRNAIAPGFTHSVDAAIAQRNVHSMYEHGIRSMRLIHDSFAAHAPHVEFMRNDLLDQVARLIPEDPLRSAWDFWRALPNVEGLPDPPSYGSLTEEDIRSAIYLYS